MTSQIAYAHDVTNSAAVAEAQKNGPAVADAHILPPIFFWRHLLHKYYDIHFDKVSGKIYHSFDMK